MDTGDERERQWREIADLKLEVGKLRLTIERLELFQAGTQDGVFELIEMVKKEAAARAAADDAIAQKAADAIVEALRSRLDMRTTVVSALTSVTAQSLAWWLSATIHR